MFLPSLVQITGFTYFQQKPVNGRLFIPMDANAARLD